MSKKNQYDVKVSPEVLTEVETALAETGMRTEVYSDDNVVVAMDADQPGEGVHTSKYMKFSRVRPLLEPYSDGIIELVHRWSSDTTPVRKMTTYVVEGDSFVKQSEEKFNPYE